MLITPSSFMSGKNFYALREIMNTYNGFAVSFDNIPGTIFHGHKHGVFNSNTSNSVRAAITVTENIPHLHGYRCSGMIRFKNNERKMLLNPTTISKYIGHEYQIIDSEHAKYAQCFPEFEALYHRWKSVGTPLGDYLDDTGSISLCIPNTCRYRTVATLRDLDRTGKIKLTFADMDTAKLAYCFINSSFCYWHWRLFDGAITYPKALLLSVPVFFDQLSSQNQAMLFAIADEMMIKERDFLAYKKNAGKLQENVKFPETYRAAINGIFLKAFGMEKTISNFPLLHNNSILSA